MKAIFLLAGIALGDSLRSNKKESFLCVKERFDLSGDSCEVQPLWSAEDSIAVVGESVITSTDDHNAYVIYLDQDRMPIVRHLDAEDGSTEAVVLEPDWSGAANGNWWSIGADEKGHLHVLGGMSSYPKDQKFVPPKFQRQHALYWRTEIPGDINSFKFRGDSMASTPLAYGYDRYKFFNDHEGQLFMISNAICRVNVDVWPGVALSRYDAKKEEWVPTGNPSEEAQYNCLASSDTTEVDYRVFSKPDAFFDHRGILHVTSQVVKRTGGYDPTPVHGIFYARSHDAGKHWQRSDGFAVMLPILYASNSFQYQENAYPDIAFEGDKYGDDETVHVDGCGPVVNVADKGFFMRPEGDRDRTWVQHQQFDPEFDINSRPTLDKEGVIHVACGSDLCRTWSLDERHEGSTSRCWVGTCFKANFDRRSLWDTGNTFVFGKEGSKCDGAWQVKKVYLSHQ